MESGNGMGVLRLEFSTLMYVGAEALTSLQTPITLLVVLLYDKGVPKLRSAAIVCGPVE